MRMQETQKTTASLGYRALYIWALLTLFMHAAFTTFMRIDSLAYMAADTVFGAICAGIVVTTAIDASIELDDHLTTKANSYLSSHRLLIYSTAFLGAMALIREWYCTWYTSHVGSKAWFDASLVRWITGIYLATAAYLVKQVWDHHKKHAILYMSERASKDPDGRRSHPISYIPIGVITRIIILSIATSSVMIYIRHLTLKQ